MPGTDQRIVDAHIHFWDRARFEYSWRVPVVDSVASQLEDDEAARVWVGTAAETYDPIRRQERQRESVTWH